MAIRPHPTAAPALESAPAVPLELDIAGAQIIGDREVQEDAFLISHLGDAATLLIVADGMGGHAAGNIASNMAVQSCNRHFCHHHESRRLPALLREAVLEANKTIADMVHETEALRGMGCTLVAAVAHDATLSWASVGDSHLYLVRGGGISKLNADHSYGGFLDRMAALGQPVEPEPGCARNMLMCALTGEEIMEIDCPDTGTRISSGDWLIASSDGLNTLNRDDIIAIAGGASSARECAERLLQAVTEAQTKNQDNTTVVVIRVKTRITTPRPSIPVAPPVAPAARTGPAAHRAQGAHEPQERCSMARGVGCGRDPRGARLLARDGRIGDAGADAVGSRGHHPRDTTRSGPERPGARKQPKKKGPQSMKRGRRRNLSPRSPNPPPSVIP